MTTSPLRVKRVPVASSCLASVGYAAPHKILEIEFTHGEVYRYYGVPRRVHAELMQAASHGTYYQDHIRDVYRYTHER